MKFIKEYIQEILSIIGILVTIVLVREARNYLQKLWKKIVLSGQELLKYRLFRLLIIHIFEILVVFILVRKKILADDFLLVMIIISFSIISSNLVIGNIELERYKSLIEKFSNYETQTQELVSLREFRVKVVTEKWVEFLEALSTQISLTAVASFLNLVEVYDFSGQIIILRIPRSLESTYKVLQPRLEDVEPILLEVYNASYKLVVLVK